MSLGVTLLIALAMIALGVLSWSLDLWTDRTRRQMHRERWRKPKDPSGPQ